MIWLQALASGLLIILAVRAYTSERKGVAMYKAAPWLLMLGIVAWAVWT